MQDKQLSPDLNKIRGFEVVRDNARTAFETFTAEDKKTKHTFPKTITLPTQSDPRSAGYDFYLPKDLKMLPGFKTIVWTDVKAYMQDDEVLEIYIRSSLATKNGLMLANNVGIVDSSYYSNASNDGNIGIALVNTTGTTVDLKAGDRIAQGIFKKFLKADQSIATSDTRVGGFGSSGQ